MTDQLPEWNVGVVKRMVRTRLNETNDAVTILMKREAELEKIAGGDMMEAIASLAANAQQIERLGGDASGVRTAHAAKLAELEKAAPELAEVQERLRVARDNMKWLNLADEGLHWACFTDRRFEESSKMNTAHQTREVRGPFRTSVSQQITRRADRYNVTFCGAQANDVQSSTFGPSRTEVGKAE